MSHNTLNQPPDQSLSPTLRRALISHLHITHSDLEDSLETIFPHSTNQSNPHRLTLLHHLNELAETLYLLQSNPL